MRWLIHISILICIFGIYNQILFASRTSEMGESISPLCTVDTINPFISVISPYGGETLFGNQQKYIQWSAQDSHFISNPITIEFSNDNGSNYSTLTEYQSNSGSYLWIVQIYSVFQAKIRIKAIDSFGNQGSSESAAFIIADQSSGISPLCTVDTVDPTAELLSPNGGESLYMDDTSDILWTASDTHIAEFPIKLEYKKVSSGTWTEILDGLSNNGQFGWQIPSIISEQTLVRLTVKDAFGNTSFDQSQNPFSIGYVPPAAPQNVSVEIVNDRDAVITWDEVTQTILGTPIVPSAYLVLFNQSPDAENEAAYYFLAEVETANGYTHYNVARHAPHMYYRVVAIKYYDKRTEKLLAEIKNQPAKNLLLSWVELKSKFAECLKSGSFK
jgi:hypothetical protein